MDAARAYRSGIYPPVTGIDDNRRNVRRWRRAPPGGLGCRRTEPPSDDSAKGESAQHAAPPAPDIPHPPPLRQVLAPTRTADQSQTTAKSPVLVAGRLFAPRNFDDNSSANFAFEDFRSQIRHRR